MMIFKPGATSAFRWWKNGDHPSDNSELVEFANADGHVLGHELTEGEYVGHYSPPPGMEDLLHTECSSAWRNHGYVETGGGRVVCPGDWFVMRNSRWAIIKQTITRYEDDENVGDSYDFVWECVEERDQHFEGDEDATLAAGASHATENKHVVSFYGIAHTPPPEPEE